MLGRRNARQVQRAIATASLSNDATAWRRLDPLPQCHRMAWRGPLRERIVWATIGIVKRSHFGCANIPAS